MTDHCPACPFRCHPDCRYQGGSIRHLPEWMVRDGDEDLVDMAAVADRTDPAWAAAVTPLRCYCGHESCHAFASWTPRPVLNVTDISKPKGKKGSAWAERKESTWIDQL